jgi:myosin heavy subunit
MDPHVFSIAADAYLHMLDDHQNQAVIISGESGFKNNG